MTDFFSASTPQILGPAVCQFIIFLSPLHLSSLLAQTIFSSLPLFHLLSIHITSSPPHLLRFLFWFRKENNIKPSSGCFISEWYTEKGLNSVTSSRWRLCLLPYLVCCCVPLCIFMPEHKNGAGRTRERDQTQEVRSSTQINLHRMALKKSTAIFLEQGAIS